MSLKNSCPQNKIKEENFVNIQYLNPKSTLNKHKWYLNKHVLYEVIQFYL